MYVQGSGPAAGTANLDLGSADQGVVVHCASLLRELLPPLPAPVLHANKKPTTIRETDSSSGVEICSADGSSETFDAVIGAPTASSARYARTYCTTKQASTRPRRPASGTAGCWCRSPKASAALGSQYFDADRQYGGGVGNGPFVMNDVLEDRTLVQCVVSVVEHDPPRGRKRRASSWRRR